MNQPAQSTWTSPLHGVQHLMGLRQQFQITVNAIGDLAACKVFTPGCGFSALETIHDSTAAARTHGEQQAALLNAVQAVEA